MNVIQLHKKRPEPSLLRDFRLMWSGIDWFMLLTSLVIYASCVLVIVAGMLTIASFIAPDDITRVLAVIGGAL